ncbi:hypothetical protein AX774_g5476 [Zancudomyces culisetae]|uniref:Uncharacterized protein n=1 Tax=Zancudomyces culisetae TaxID=1213189 RepID=A0A1R1PJA6_ZANCU|nr:hypothetical protein AX774_g5476 [Zancudomyces culisetae]|eukprot:OMH81074.1 hypothetical protein AX774_g5476 [Zancudomyces culisetae]
MCAVPAILGLNTCKDLRATLNYNDNTIDIIIDRDRYRFQLMSQEDLNHIGMSDEEYSDVQSDTEDTCETSASEAEHDIVNKPMFYSLMSADLTESGFPGEVNKTKEQRFDLHQILPQRL